jgi:hypothetical protein
MDVGVLEEKPDRVWVPLLAKDCPDWAPGSDQGSFDSRKISGEQFGALVLSVGLVRIPEHQ